MVNLCPSTSSAVVYSHPLQTTLCLVEGLRAAAPDLCIQTARDRLYAGTLCFTMYTLYWKVIAHLPGLLMQEICTQTLWTPVPTSATVEENSAVQYSIAEYSTA